MNGTLQHRHNHVPTVRATLDFSNDVGGSVNIAPPTTSVETPLGNNSQSDSALGRFDPCHDPRGLQSADIKLRRVGHAYPDQPHSWRNSARRIFQKDEILKVRRRAGQDGGCEADGNEHADHSTRQDYRRAPSSNRDARRRNITRPVGSEELARHGRSLSVRFGQANPLPVRSAPGARSSPQTRPQSRCRAAWAGRWRHRGAGAAAGRRGAGYRSPAASYIYRSCPRRAHP